MVNCWKDQKEENEPSELAQLTNKINDVSLEDKYECNICFSGIISRALSCGHSFCSNCTMKFLESKCPHCNQVPQGFQIIYFG